MKPDLESPFLRGDAGGGGGGASQDGPCPCCSVSALGAAGSVCHGNGIKLP